jgi:hypothetical protein
MRKVECRVVCRPAPTLRPPPPPKRGRMGGGLSANSPAGHGLHRSFSPPPRDEGENHRKDTKTQRGRIPIGATRHGGPKNKSAGEARAMKLSILPRPRAETQSLRVFASLRFSPSSSVPAGHGFSNRAAGGKLFLIVCQDQGSLRSRRGAAAAWRRSGQATRGLSRRADRPSPHVSGSPAPHRPGRDDRMEAYRERVVLLLSWRRSSGSRCHRSTCDAG